MSSRGKLRNAVILVVACALALVTIGGAAPSASSPSPMVKVIVEGTSVEYAATAVYANGGQVTAKVTLINAVIAQVPQDRLNSLAEAHGVVRVTPDRPVQTAGQRVDVEFSQAIGAKEVWGTGNLGAGVTVAILDSGLNPNFATLRRPAEGKANRILAYYDVPSGQMYDPRHLQRSPQDPNGHGTHVAGIIANSAYEHQDGEYRGVAPAANLVAVRVLDETGVGSYSDVIQGIDWVVQNKDTYNIRVLNISLYSPAFAPYWADPLNLATMAAWEAGIVVVVSAGNSGPDPMSIGVPGNTPYIITVGAFTDNYTPEDYGDDYMPPFSATGPTLDAFVKPDVIAPGAHVISLMKKKTYLSEQYPENRISTQYFQMAGTSMSAGVVSGVAALMLSENPELTPDQVKYRLMMTARPQFSEYSGEAAYSVWEQGAGRVWAPDAVFADIEGEANWGMDLDADLAGEEHYEGWTTYDPESGEFKIREDGFNSWAGGFNSWAGGFHSWAGGYDSWAGGTTNWSGDYNSWIEAFNSWAGGFNSWAGSYGSWASGFNSWAGGFNSWAGGFNSWAGGFNSWAGGYSAWAGGFNSWAGGFNSWAGNAGDPEWAAAFANLENVPSGTSAVGINNWISEN